MTAPGNRIWEHATETVLLLESAALAAVAILPGWGVPVYAIPALVFFSGIITTLVAWMMTGSARLCWAVLAMCLFLTAWTGWASLAGVWHAMVIITWFAGLVAFIPLTALAAAHARDSKEPVMAQPDPEAAKRAEMASFQHMFDELGFERVRVTDLQRALSGRVVRLTLPRSAPVVTIGDLETTTGRIEVLLQMRPGKVEFTQGDHAGDVFLRLRESEFLGSKIPLRPEHRASTITKPFAIGVQEDGTLGTITLRELHARIIGTTGTGKSNLINVLLAQLCGMVDTVVWVIDLKGGRTARPWLRPYADGIADGPAIDWVATTREEAALMMYCFVKAVEARMNSGIGGSKIKPSASMPQIVLICDEAADIIGQGKGGRKQVGEGGTTNFEFTTMAETITQKGRSEACASVWATQRGTNTMSGSGDMKANITLEIMLGMAKESEARWVNADNPAAQKRSAALIDTKGAGTITKGRKGSLATQFFFLDHPEVPGTETDETLCDDGCVPSCPVYRAALETASVRPQLDLLTAQGMGEEYASRWSRAGNLIQRQGPAGAATLAGRVDTSDFEGIMKGGGFKDPEDALNDRQKAIVDYLRTRGVMAGTPSQIGEHLDGLGLGAARETIQRDLTKLLDKGMIHKADFGRYRIGADPKQNAA